MAGRASEAACARLDDEISAHRSAATAAVESSADPVEIDSELRRLSTSEAALRVVFGTLASELCRGKAHHRLGFARLGDYTRERLGMAPREVESLAHVTTALRALPLVAASFARGELSWTHTRLLAAVSTPATEAAWLECARGCSTARLAALVGASSAAARPTGAAVAADCEPNVHSAHCPQGDLASPPSDPATQRRLLEATLDETFDRADGEPALRFRLRCPPQLRGLFYDTVELARRVSGEQLPVSDAAEVIAAEALSGAPRVAPIGHDVAPAADTPEPFRKTPIAAPEPPLAPSMPVPCKEISSRDIASPSSESSHQSVACNLDTRLRSTVAARCERSIGRSATSSRRSVVAGCIGRSGFARSPTTFAIASAWRRAPRGR
ncbi:MAG: hypothetical protein HY271_11925 [Deltaproteobacteria bacterium]|nr:hypothetical protein [Deltaproteobacteria bacterium]